MKRWMIAAIAAGGVVAAAAVGGTVWAVVSGVGLSAEPSVGVDVADTVDDELPFFRADQLTQFFLDEAVVEKITGQPLALHTAGTEYRAVLDYTLARECGALLGLVDQSPAGAREQFDRSRDAFDFVFYQSVYQFAPAEGASARFDEMAESFASCARFDLGPDVSAEVTDHFVVSGEVSVLSAEVTVAYGFDGESFMIVVSQTANVISVSQVWQRFGSETGLPKDARTQLTTAMTEQAAAALAGWIPVGVPDDSSVTAVAPEADPPPQTPQFSDVNGTWCYWADASSCFTIDLPKVGSDMVVRPPQAGDFYPPSGDGYTYVIPGEECFTASAVAADGDEFGGAVFYFCPRGVSSSEVGFEYNFNNESFDRVYVTQEGPRDPSFRLEDWAAAVGR